MPRCRSWRPTSEALTADSIHADCAPGVCRQHWQPCRERAGRRGERCDSCWEMLAQHPQPSIRALVCAEPDIPDWVLDVLAEDDDEYVRMVAADRGRRNAAGIDV